MGTRDHGDIGMRMGHLRERLDQLVPERQDRLGAGRAQHQGIGQVVDVLGGAGEVQKPGDRGKLGMRREPLPQEIFDRLDVVVGARLDGLDPLGVVLIEALDEVIEKRLRLRTERGDLGYLGPAREALEPADLDQDPMPDEAVFTEDGPQRLGLPGIAAVQGRDRGEGGEVHGSACERVT